MGVLFVLLFIGLLIAGGFVTFRLTHNAKGGYSLELHPLRGVPFYVGALFFLFLSMSFVTVDAGNVGVVKRFGNPIRQLDPGPHFIRPIADSLTPVVVQTRIVKPSEDAASHDLQVVHTEVTLAYHTDPMYATQVLVTLNDDAENRVVAPAILEAIKSTTAQYDAQQLIAERPAVRDGIEAFVKARLTPYHIIAETTSITDFRFSDDYEKAIEAKVTAQQNAEKAKNDLTRIQVEAQQKVAQATGEAEALKVQKEQITPELIQLRTVEMMDKHWDGHLPETYIGGNNGALPMMDVLAEARAKKQ
jgi:regulator of protease activity HflC (stomatin/prohibitin superfamily)